MKPLKTLKGSRIWYSAFGVGKKVGSKIYVHDCEGQKSLVFRSPWGCKESDMT